MTLQKITTGFAGLVNWHGSRNGDKQKRLWISHVWMTDVTNVAGKFACAINRVAQSAAERLLAFRATL